MEIKTHCRICSAAKMYRDSGRGARHLAEVSSYFMPRPEKGVPGMHCIYALWSGGNGKRKVPLFDWDATFVVQSSA